MKTAMAANDNGLHPFIENLSTAINAVEDHADEFSDFDFAEVERLYEILKEMVEK